MSIEKSIGWTDITKNPIKGRCRGGCWYCYYSGKRGIANRFKHNPKIRIECNCLMNLPKIPKKIFLCSTHDLFGEWIPKGWRDTIFRWIERYPQHAFQILTKFPQNIDRPMPSNVWLGVTVDGTGNSIRNPFDLMKIKAKIRFVSIEPMLKFPGLFFDIGIDWVIMGRLTGHGKKHDPKEEWIGELIYEARRYNIPIFLKNNLVDIWKPLIQEMPKGGNDV